MGIFDRFRRPKPAQRGVPVLLADGTTSSTFLPGHVVQGSWGNPVTGLGMSGQDHTADLVYNGGKLPSAMSIDRLYTFDWLAKRIVQKMPSIALVRGFKGVDEALMKEYRRLNFTERFPMGAFERAVDDGRAHGGAVLLLGYKRGNPAEPLSPADAKSGLAFLDVFAQHELEVVARVRDPLSPDFGMPAVYHVIANASGQIHPRAGTVFHATRAIRFSGNPLRVPNTGLETFDVTGAHSQPELGVSVLVDVLREIGQYGLSWSAASNMLQDASIGWMKIAGLVEALASEDKEIIEDRLRTLQQTKALHRMFWLDADHGEEYGRTEVKLTDVPTMLQMFIVAISGAADCPARIFFGTSPAGLNANSSNEGDLTQLYNTAASYQRSYLGPRANRLLTATNGGREVEVGWPSLWEASDGEKAQTRLAHSNADKTYYDMGYSAEQISKARKEGNYIELSGEKPEDDREAVASAGASADPPNGAPDKAGASKIAAAQRSAG